MKLIINISKAGVALLLCSTAFYSTARNRITPDVLNAAHNSLKSPADKHRLRPILMPL